MKKRCIIRVINKSTKAICYFGQFGNLVSRKSNAYIFDNESHAYSYYKPIQGFYEFFDFEIEKI